MRGFIFMVLMLNVVSAFAQQDIYLAPSANLSTFPGSAIAVFGNIFNDASGGWQHQNGGDVFLYRHQQNGSGRTVLMDGPNTISPLDSYNKASSYISVWNLHTDNTTGAALKFHIIPGIDSGMASIILQQELRVSGTHYFEHGNILTNPAKWGHAYLHYIGDSVQYSGYSDSMNIIGYAAYSGCRTFTFPIGDGIKKRPATVVNPACGIYKTAYFHANPQGGWKGISGAISKNDSVKYCSGNIYKVNRSEFWDIDGTGKTQLAFLSLNSTAGYSDFDSLNNFSGRPASDLVITGYNGAWKNLKIGSPAGTFKADSIYSSSVAIVPDSSFSVFSWALADSLYSFISNESSLFSKDIISNYYSTADGKLILRTESNGQNKKLYWNIYTMTGTELNRGQFSTSAISETVELDISTYAAGVYLMHIHSESGEASQSLKIIRVK